MAQNKPQKANEQKKPKGPQQKPGIGTRLRQFIGGLKSELKRVVWPDKKTLKQTAIAVAIIIVISAALIFIVDSILGAALRATGFDTPGIVPNPTVQTQVSTTPAETTDATETTTITVTTAEE